MEAIKSNKLGKSTDIYFSEIIMDDVIWVHGGTIVENRVHDKKSRISVMNLFVILFVRMFAQCGYKVNVVTGSTQNVTLSQED